MSLIRDQLQLKPIDFNEALWSFQIRSESFNRFNAWQSVNDRSIQIIYLNVDYQLKIDDLCAYRLSIRNIPSDFPNKFL